MSIYTDCQAIPDYVADDCGNIENGRVRHLILKKKTATITDPSNASEWNALIASGDALVIKNVRGSYDGGVVVESTGFGDNSAQLTGRNHVLTYMDYTVKNNVSFYNEFAMASNNYNVYFATESLIWGQTKGIQLASTLPITDNLQEGINFNVTVKWAEMEMPTPYTSPSTLFTV
jgi:hypothetical protein